ncbi:MAG: rod shape-determining protein RodA [Bacillota bacterium]|nr:rod shape-determining protein RodA [Bacillota bacterium]
MLKNLIINRKLLKQLDFGMIITVLIISLFGVMNIYSCTYKKYGMYYLEHQLLWIVLGLFIMYIMISIDYSLFGSYSKIIYGIGILSLVYIDVFGKISGGARSWVGIGSRGIQPSEFVKIAAIIMVAKMISDFEGNINEPKNLIKLIGVVLIPMILIVIQPDMGMTMVLFFIFLGVFYAAGLDNKIIIGGFLAVLILVLILWKSGLFEVYQMGRIFAFLNPDQYELTYAYQATQSQIGIGSGGILGKGFLKGTYSSGFIPEISTDYIYAVVGEEWGLLGGLGLIFFYGFLIFKMIIIGKSSKDIFGQVLVSGTVATFLFLILENIGMAIGIMPVTGITLPLMSYGGSSILSSFISLGIVLNVGMRRKKINF